MIQTFFPECFDPFYCWTIQIQIRISDELGFAFVIRITSLQKLRIRDSNNFFPTIQIRDSVPFFVNSQPYSFMPRMSQSNFAFFVCKYKFHSRIFFSLLFFFGVDVCLPSFLFIICHRNRHIRSDFDVRFVFPFTIPMYVYVSVICFSTLVNGRKRPFVCRTDFV